MEESKNKFYPTADELNPSLKLLQNRVLKRFDGERTFKEKYRKVFHLMDTEEQDNVRKTSMKLKASKDLQDLF